MRINRFFVLAWANLLALVNSSLYSKIVSLNVVGSVSMKNNLLFFGLDESMRYKAPNVMAFKSGSTMCPCNRAIINKDTDLIGLQALHDFYDGIPYALWMDEKDDIAKNKAGKQGFHHAGFFSAMKLDINRLKATPIDNHIIVRPVASDDELFTTWIPIVVKSYAPHLVGDEQKNYIEQLSIFIKYLQKVHMTQDLVFYLGLWSNVPVSTAMFIRSPGFVGIHRIGTLPEFRKKGVGYAITSMPLHEFKKQEIDQALLLASSSGLSLYERMGFEKLLTYEVYTKK